MTDVETKVATVGNINEIQSTDLSQPLRDAVATIVQAIPASDSRFRTTQLQDGKDIAVELLQSVDSVKSQWKEGRYSGSSASERSENFVKTTLRDSSIGDVGIVETVGHLAADHKGSIPNDVKDALRTMATAGGMSAENADKNLSLLERGEQELHRAKGFFHDDKEGMARGQIDINAAMGPLKDAIEKGLKLDLATHASRDAAAIAKLPALQPSPTQSAERK